LCQSSHYEANVPNLNDIIRGVITCRRHAHETNRNLRPLTHKSRRPDIEEFFVEDISE